ncbi:MAG: hypothetical protein HC882_04965 [Acidobacteria bacterium]|nr:hypothetical protein [Acidobacteriota bacterium]
MSFEIKIREDQTVEYVSRFKQGRGSLAAMGAESLCRSVNKLDVYGIAATMLGVRNHTWDIVDPASTTAQRIAKDLLASVRAPEAGPWIEKIRSNASLGEYRQSLVLRYCGGMNAPGDLWIRAVAGVIGD